MDGTRFDALTKRLATGGTSRRRFLSGLGTVAVAVLLGGGRQVTLAAQPAERPVETGPNCDACGLACPTATCPWPCCGLRHEPGPSDPCANCDSVCSNCPIACCLALHEPGPVDPCATCDSVCSNCPIGCCLALQEHGHHACGEVGTICLNNRECCSGRCTLNSVDPPRGRCAA